MAKIQAIPAMEQCPLRNTPDTLLIKRQVVARPPTDWCPVEGGHAAPGRTRTAERRAGLCRSEPLPPADTCVHTPPGHRENSRSCLSKVTTAVRTSMKCRSSRGPVSYGVSCIESYRQKYFPSVSKSPKEHDRELTS